MTREERFASIYTHETVYCPPHESDSALLEVALGCSWGRCTFCDFARDRFQILPMEKIEQNIQVLGELVPEKKRVFLLGENAFVLEYEKLVRIFQLIHTYMPSVEEIAMYGRIDDVLRKTDQQILELRKMGLRDLHIGIESGSDSILQMVNKGVTTAQMLTALSRLDQLEIGYYLTVILGLGGRTYRNLHAIETARLLNRTHPKNIWALSLKLWPGTTLYKMAQRGEFDPMDYHNLLLEERLLLENLTVENCTYIDTTVLGRYTIQGTLPDGKEALLKAVNQLLAE